TAGDAPGQRLGITNMENKAPASTDAGAANANSYYRVLLGRKRDDVRAQPIGIVPVHQPHTERAIALEVLRVVLHRDSRRREIVIIERLRVSALQAEARVNSAVSQERRLVHLMTVTIECDYHIPEFSWSALTRCVRRKQRCCRDRNENSAVVKAIRIFPPHAAIRIEYRIKQVGFKRE